MKKLFFIEQKYVSSFQILPQSYHVTIASGKDEKCLFLIKTSFLW